MSVITNRDRRLYDILFNKLNPEKLVISNQSDQHRYHGGDDGSGETHYDILIVSDAFKNLSKIYRHRLVTDLLIDEFNSGLHALSLSLKTKEEAQ